MPPVNQVYANTGVLKELVDFQSSMYDKASTYTKLIMGLGYGGFFVAWSGTKVHLSPKLLVWSALLMTVSLILYVLYEIYSMMITSYLSIDFVETFNKPGSDKVAAFRKHQNKKVRLTAPILSIWKFIFPVSALTGLAAASILVYAFVASLLRM